jgi:hypothetical protein
MKNTYLFNIEQKTNDLSLTNESLHICYEMDDEF